MIKNKKISRLTIKFVTLVITTLIICGLLFSFLFQIRYHVFNFFIDNTSIIQSTDEAIESLQKNITNKKISKQDRKKILNEMKKYKYLTMQLYDDNGSYFADHFSPLEKNVYIQTTSLSVMLYFPEFEFYTLKFYDGEYNLTVYPYQGVWFMGVYLICIIILCCLVFIIVIMRFVNKKIKFVYMIEDEMKLMESGDYTHPIIYRGKDELSDLAKQVNELRVILKRNIQSEKEAKEANHDLVTAMSHDLRTPLTSLLGYLDILDMKIYKNNFQRDSYIKKCKLKAEQIKEMSDRLFMHFMIYAQDEDITLVSITSNQFNAMIEEFGLELIDTGFEIDLQIEEHQYNILADMTLWHRILDNLISNIRKYACGIIKIHLYKENQNIILKVSNEIKERGNEESSKIGLKSIKKMISDMNGNMNVVKKNNEFSIIIQIPENTNITKHKEI